MNQEEVIIQILWRSYVCFNGVINPSRRSNALLYTKEGTLNLIECDDVKYVYFIEEYDKKTIGETFIYNDGSINIVINYDVLLDTLYSVEENDRESFCVYVILHELHHCQQDIDLKYFSNEELAKRIEYQNDVNTYRFMYNYSEYIKNRIGIPRFNPGVVRYRADINLKDIDMLRDDEFNYIQNNPIQF